MHVSLPAAQPVKAEQVPLQVIWSVVYLPASHAEQAAPPAETVLPEHSGHG